MAIPLLAFCCYDGCRRKATRTLSMCHPLSVIQQFYTCKLFLNSRMLKEHLEVLWRQLLKRKFLQTCKYILHPHVAHRYIHKILPNSYLGNTLHLIMCIPVGYKMQFIFLSRTHREWVTQICLLKFSQDLQASQTPTHIHKATLNYLTGLPLNCYSTLPHKGPSQVSGSFYS